MAKTEIQTVRFNTNDNNASSEAQLHINVYDDKDRLKRALMRLGLFWLLALGSLPIIFAHWVLVPGFIIAGPFAAFAVYRTTRLLDRASGQCPVCKEPIDIKFEAKDSLPKWTYCPACKNALQVTG